MAATQAVQTKAQLLAQVDALFPDNHDDAIEPEHARDFFLDLIASAFGCYAGMLINGGSAPTNQFTLAAATFQDLKPLTFPMPTDTLVVSLANGTITVPSAAAAGDYMVEFNVVLERDAVVPGAGEDQFFIRLVKNGVEVIARNANIGANDKWGTFSAKVPIALVNGDVIKLQIAHFTGGQATAVSVDFTAERRG